MIEEIGRFPLIKMEEEEEEGEFPFRRKRKIGFGNHEDDLDDKEHANDGLMREAYAKFLSSLAEERGLILKNDKLSTKQKKVLLDESRKALVVANGGTVKKTDSIVYGILVFGGAVLIILSLLTVFADLPSEVTLAFVGTVLGGTIATIAQKLGKL